MTTLARVTLRATNGVSADNVINTFHFGPIGEAAVPDPTAVSAALIAFYLGDVGPGGAGIEDFLCPSISRNPLACKIDLYDVAAAPGTPPYHQAAFTLGPPTGDPLPGEVAAALSWTATGHDGPLGGRYRGRTFLGRLNTECLVNDVGSGWVTRLSPNFFDTVAAAAQDLIEADLELVIYSKASATKVPPQALDQAHPVTGGFLDNAFDTIRSRGQAPNYRLTF